MKVIYSLQEFHKKAVEISGKNPELVSVVVQLGLYNNYEFKCYADGLNQFFTGKTMEESLSKMQEAVTPANLNNTSIDVEIEMPEKEAADAEEK